MTVPTLRLGVNTCFAVKRWPHPEEWAPIVRDVLGLDLVQHSLDLVDLGAGAAARDAQADRLRDACAANGLALDSVFTGLAAYSSSLLLDPEEDARRRASSWWRAVLDFSARAGAPRAGGHLGSLSVADARDPARRAARTATLRDDLAALARHAHTAGLDAILFENMACAREPSTLADAEALLEPAAADRAAIALCLDVGHQCVPGTSGDDRDPYAWLRRLGARAPVVHLQQSDAEGDHHWPFTAARNAEGRIEAGRVLAALDASGARDVALVLEPIFPFEADDDAVLADLTESAAYWRAALGAHAAAPPTTEERW